MLIDNLAKLNSKSRIAISAALVVMTAAIMFDWAVAPHVVYLSATGQYGAVLAEMIKTGKVLESGVEVKKKKLQELSGRFANLQSALFTVKDAKEFFSDLQAISEQSGCVVYSFNFGSDDQRPDAGQLSGQAQSQGEDASGITAGTAMLGVIGGYSDIVKLVERLKSRPQRVCIDSLKMAGNNDGTGQLKCDIAIKIYIIQDKETFSHE